MASLRHGCANLAPLVGAKVSIVPLTTYATTRLAEPRAIMTKSAIKLDIAPPCTSAPPSRYSGLISGHRIGQLLPNQSRRFSHSDVASVPSFDHYRHKSNIHPTASGEEAEMARRVYTYSILGVGGAVCLYGAKATVATFLSILPPSAKEYAVAQTEIKLSDIPEGKNIVFKWRKKPLFVRHRTAEEIERERSVDISTLRDPQADSDRVARDKWLVVLGICTHLGCVPIANKGDFGGYFCPCHGSHYDASGRIRKGPAPLNLEIPKPLVFDDENDLLIVG